jgi:hypothetical protein
MQHAFVRLSLGRDYEPLRKGKVDFTYTLPFRFTGAIDKVTIDLK